MKRTFTRDRNALYYKGRFKTAPRNLYITQLL